MTATAVAVRERPIIMSGPSVRAIMGRAKTQTRRVVKPQPLWCHYLAPCWGKSPDGYAFGTPGVWTEAGPDYPDGPDDERRCPYGAPGDRLWVREAFFDFGTQDARIKYRADDEEIYNINRRWQSPIFMPRLASRLTLELTTVRIERLQDIGRYDAEEEGFRQSWESVYIAMGGDAGYSQRNFRKHWDSLNASRCHGWDTNPWVWALSFRRVQP